MNHKSIICKNCKISLPVKITVSCHDRHASDKHRLTWFVKFRDTNPQQSKPYRYILKYFCDLCVQNCTQKSQTSRIVKSYINNLKKNCDVYASIAHLK